MRFNDAVIGLVLIVVAAVTIWLTRSFPAMPGQKYGPELFPRILAAGIAIGGVILVVNGLRNRRPLLALAAWTREPQAVVNFIAVPVALLLYILVSDLLGFLLTAILITFGLLYLFRRRPVSSLVIAVASVAVIQLAFTRLLLVPLPRGILESLIG